jgi:hypothetical protein
MLRYWASTISRYSEAFSASIKKRSPDWKNKKFSGSVALICQLKL